jgi:hypothetical protein
LSRDFKRPPRGFKAERDGEPFIISNGPTIAEFLDEPDLADSEALDGLVSVIEFEDEAERDVQSVHAATWKCYRAGAPKPDE